MGRAYARALPGFDRALDDCIDAFPSAARDRVRAAILDPEFPAAELDETGLAQPALFAVGYAAADALVSLCGQPDLVAGHSLGEITAACVAGALDLADAAALVVARGEAMQACPRGAMLAVRCDPDTAQRLLDETGCDLDLAAVNAPDACVLSGADSEVERLRARLPDTVVSSRLRTTRAFHSRLVEPAVAPIADAVAAAPLRPLRVPLVSGVDGRVCGTGESLPPTLLVDQARQPVRFDAAMAAIAAALPDGVAVEIGPGAALSPMAESAGLDTVQLLRRSTRTAEDVLGAIGALWTSGRPVSPVLWSGRVTRLPTYPFAGPRWVAPEAVPRPGDSGEAVGGRAGAGAPADAGASRDGEPAHEVDGGARGDDADPAAVVASAWADLLGGENLTPDADFFALGGDSLLITRLARTVNSALAINVPIHAMLASRTLGRQTELVLELVADRGPVPDGEGRR